MHNLDQLLSFFHQCERLKMEKRFGKTSDGENDRVASHSWRMAVMIMFLAPHVGKDFDQLKAIKMALIHDLAEIVTGDQAYFHHFKDQQAKEIKQHREENAMLQLRAGLPIENQQALMEIWREYEDSQTFEAKLVKAIDKMEAHLQHNEADISVWNTFDRENYATYLDSFCDFHPLLIELKTLIQSESTAKLKLPIF